MNASKILFTVLIVFCVSVNAQQRSGVYLGIDFFSGSHTNPYVSYSGSEINPTSFKGYSDNTTQFYVPFGYATYSKDGFGEFSSYAMHFLVVGAVNLLNPNKEYKFSTDKTYIGDSYADGYVPVFGDVDQTSSLWNYGPGKGLEASYTETDLFRFVFATNELTSTIKMPFMIGAQGGVGGFGVHFAKVQEGHEPSDVNSDGPGLVNFNDAVDLYFGANIGYGTEIMGEDLALVSLQYDWHYFIKGVEDDSQLKGNRITVELTYFPFSSESGFLSNIFFKGYYRHNSIPYMKKFAESIETTYTNTIVGLGVSYFLL